MKQVDKEVHPIQANFSTLATMNAEQKGRPSKTPIRQLVFAKSEGFTAKMFVNCAF